MTPNMTTEEAIIAAKRVMARCETLAAITSTPGQVTRVYLSPEHQRANMFVGEWMRAIGMTVWQDAVGNICGRYEGDIPDAPALLLGSHLDTVRNAGKYDGILGVLTALEVVQHLHAHRQRMPFPIEIVGFADEEGTRFGITLLGSKGLTGQWEPNWLARKDAAGVTVQEALTHFGLDYKKIIDAKRAQSDFCGYLELHIEQGPCLEQANLALGVVTAINGARRLKCTFTGHAGHAGTVPMGQRKDASVAAAMWIVAVEQMTQASSPLVVATTGTIEVSPGAVNVIPGKVTVSLDIRAPEDTLVDRLLPQLLSKAEAICAERGLTFTSEEFYHISATPCEPVIEQRWHQAVKTVQGQSMSLPSGAGHDAIAIAEQWPVGMLFVRCDKGISHHPAESVIPADVALGIQAFTHVVTHW